MVTLQGVITARVRSTREGNVLTSICPSIHPSVCPQGGGGVRVPCRGGSGYPPGGPGTPPGVWVPPWGVWVPPGGPGTPLGGSRHPPGGSGYPPGGVQVPPPGGGVNVKINNYKLIQFSPYYSLPLQGSQVHLRGGMPLAFTQEDFLVPNVVNHALS